MNPYLDPEFLKAIRDSVGTAAVDAQAADVSAQIRTDILVQSISSWDGTPYISYPVGRPQITILKITIAPHTTMKWHSHPFPNAGYIVAGELTIERENGTKEHFVAGQAITETVDRVHRGITGPEQTVLIVFYPGTPGLPLSQAAIVDRSSD